MGGMKRSYSEVEPPANVNGYHGSKEQRHRDKKQKIKPLKRKEDNMNWVRKRARTIERLFQKEDANLPANVRKDLERELAAHKLRIEREGLRKERSKMIGKYHMVRFFERKKAQRMAKQLRKQIEQATDPEEIAALKADLHIAEVDTNYAIYFPFMERYVSLYTVAKEAKESTAEEKAALAKLALHAPRPAMWSTVEKAMEEGQEALERLQQRRSESESQPKATKGSAKSKAREAKPKFNKKEFERNKVGSGANTEAVSDRGKWAEIVKKRKEEEEADAGFFEEI